MPGSPYSIPLLRAAAWSDAPLVEGSEVPWLDLATGAPDTTFLDPLLRRRLSPLGRAMLHTAGRVSAGLGPLRSVFASRHGDVGRTPPILEDLAKGLPTSPTHFSMSVHNAVAGIWSISRGDRSASLSLAAGPETFGLGLLEALALLQEDPAQPVLYVYGEEPLPEPFRAFAEPELPLHALALLLGEPALGRLEVVREPGAAAPAAAAPQALQVLQVLASGEPQGPWREGTGAWSWRRQAP